MKTPFSKCSALLATLTIGLGLSGLTASPASAEFFSFYIHITNKEGTEEGISGNYLAPPGPLLQHNNGLKVTGFFAGAYFAEVFNETPGHKGRAWYQELNCGEPSHRHYCETAAVIAPKGYATAGQTYRMHLKAYDGTTADFYYHT